jgi:RHH-type proline utilization regulon transcriptional repressor/proline dehydrogenase/delta 1-pyrroline-5-carboxylate dehydrogenase
VWNPEPARRRIRSQILADEADLSLQLVRQTGLDEAARAEVSLHARKLVEAVRSNSHLGLMESFLAEYGLATDEGLALMTLAEALLRVPDAETVDALIQDKVGASEWSAHFGASQSPIVNFSTRALSLAADVVGDPGAGTRSALHSAIRRLGEPVIRAAVSQAMRMLGSQFVFGRNIDEAIARSREGERDGDRYSYDMLGEAARTEADAARYMRAYGDAIARLAPLCTAQRVRDNPGISVKLSALHPRYEFAQRERVLTELVATTRTLALAARNAGMGFNIDAEEAERLDLSLDVIAAVLAMPELAGWEGFGVVVQAYGKRALPVIDWLDELAASLNRRIMVRLVKGAYWDAEIKRAQTLGLDGFPVFTRKAATDVSYIAAAHLLLAKSSIYPQFATHNAHTAAAVLHLAQQANRGTDTYEFQRLHGMGKPLHDRLKTTAGTRTRIYAPVGMHKDLLAYLVRRLLENGANASFVYQIADEDIPAEIVAEDPIAKIVGLGKGAKAAIAMPCDLFQPSRQNSAGIDLTDPVAVETVLAARAKFRTQQWQAVPLIAATAQPRPPQAMVNPARPDDVVGSVAEASPDDIEAAFVAAGAAFPQWSSRSAAERAALLRKVADLYEANRPELFAILAREAGKTLADAVSEVREAVDFLRYYAAEAEARPNGRPRGIVACISPWNFPLAIFTGQIAASLAAGNVVLAKPAGQTPIVACRAVQLMHAAGIPAAAIQLLPGDGNTVGAALSRDPRVAGVVFTGSLPTAHRIDRAAAEAMAPDAPLIAETGGINAMIVDSTALPEQAVRDILSSAFQSAGQRCSALRIAYVQEDAADRVVEMLLGAMAELTLGDPWELETDIGPVIDAAARDGIDAHIATFAARGDVLRQLPRPLAGTFVGPAVLRVNGIEDIATEVFGPVLHIATYRADDLDRVVATINASGYGLTFGLHTRISSRSKALATGVRAGNIYVNRNQIGAVVGSQPFGGEGLSGTGPKAGGPHCLPRLQKPAAPESLPVEMMFPGPTGESNVMRLVPRGTLLCLGPSPADVERQIAMAAATGNAHKTADGAAPRDLLAGPGFDAVASFGGDLRTIRQALSARDGAIIPLITDPAETARLCVERHVCIDTTAAGGNASLMAETARAT